VSQNVACSERYSSAFDVLILSFSGALNDTKFVDLLALNETRFLFNGLLELHFANAKHTVRQITSLNYHP
jgi:hypothetical protein